MTGSAAPGKAEFDGIYNQPDARAYFTTLETLDYSIPQYGADVFSQLLDVRRHTLDGQATVLDVCCSYGIGGMLLTTDLRLKDLYAHYREATELALTRDELLPTDRKLLSEHRKPEPPRVIGLDVAEPAVDYAVEIGALDDGAVANLEESAPSPQLAEMLADVDLITSTGGTSYVTEQTIGQLVEHASATPWVAAFCIRTCDYEPISTNLDDRGLRTERALRTFPQRRFIDAAEQDWAISQVVARGYDPGTKEAEGSYHAEFYLSRPAEQVAEQPLDALLPELF